MSHDIANRGEILLYSDENGREFVNVIFKDETFWPVSYTHLTLPTRWSV